MVHDLPTHNTSWVSTFLHQREGEILKCWPTSLSMYMNNTEVSVHHTIDKILSKSRSRYLPNTHAVIVSAHDNHHNKLPLSFYRGSMDVGLSLFFWLWDLVSKTKSVWTRRTPLCRNLAFVLLSKIRKRGKKRGRPNNSKRVALSYMKIKLLFSDSTKENLVSLKPYE